MVYGIFDSSALADMAVRSPAAAARSHDRLPEAVDEARAGVRD